MPPRRFYSVFCVLPSVFFLERQTQSRLQRPRRRAAEDRGRVEERRQSLIVAGVGINEGLVNPDEFSAIVVMVLITTLVTPPILRSLFSQQKEKQKESSEANKTSASVNPKNEEAD